MTQQYTNRRSGHRAKARAVAASRDDQQRLMRGLLHGILFSAIIWLAAGYLTFILH